MYKNPRGRVAVRGFLSKFVSAETDGIQDP